MLPPGNRHSKIKPPRKSIIASSIGGGANEVDYDKSWSVLANAIAQIQHKDVSHLSYEQLYRKAYVLVLRKLGAKLYDDVAKIIVEHLVERREKLVKVMETLTLKSTNEGFMKAVLVEWDEHLQSMKFVSDILMYLNRVHVKELKKLLIYDLGIQLFKDHVIKYDDNMIGSKLIEAILDEFTKNRKGEVITTKMYIIKIINMFELLVETPAVISDVQYGENYYQKYFEPAFLDNSYNFFNSLSQELLNFQSGTRYLADVRAFIAEEENKLKSFLPEPTYPKVIDLLNNVMIRDKIERVLSFPTEQQGLSFLLQPVLNIFQDKVGINNREENMNLLKIVYELVGRIDPEYHILKAHLRSQVIAQGFTFPSLVKDSLDSKNVNQNRKSNNASLFACTWIKAVLEYQNQFKSIVNEAFFGNASLEHTIIMAMREFINITPLTGSKKQSSGASVNAPELLSVFIDYHIKQLSSGQGKGDASSSIDPVDQHINEAIAFLRFVKDKDAFEAHYANHFAKRFLNSKGSNLSSRGTRLGSDLEDLVISKLSEEMGTTSMERIMKMNKDIKSSSDMTQDWKKYASQKEGVVDVELKICNVADWPKSLTKDYKNFRDGDGQEEKFMWPKQLRHTMKQFEEFWLLGKRNDNKSLYWSPKFGSVDLKISYPTGTYDINVSTYAGVIMLLFAPQSKGPDGVEVLAFEEKRSLSFIQIKELTGIADSELRRQLQSIAVAPRLRLLIKVPMSKEVSDSDMFMLNEKFKYPSSKVKVLTVSAPSSNSSRKKESESGSASYLALLDDDVEEVEQSILEGRKHEINAAVVRIMKSRRVLSHNELVSELIKQLHHRFQCLPLLIKQRIEDLIDKEYLRRDDVNKSVYHYIA